MKNTITFQFHRGDKKISKLIRLFSPEVNHTSILLKRTVYEAHIRNGVQKHKSYEWKGGEDIIQTISFEVTDKQFNRVKKFLEAQVGKGYDVYGIISFIWILKKPKIGYWYCSELAKVAMYKMIGIESNSNDYDQKVSPYQLLRELEALREVYVK